MKTTIILFFLSITSVFSQVECSEQNQQFSGKCESYNSGTGIRSKYTYKKGELHGKFEESFKNGQLRSEGSYRSGSLNGKFSAFYKTGEKLSEGKFKSGTGSFTMFHTNGTEKVKGQFLEGREIGKWTFYNSSGDLTRERDAEYSELNMYLYLVGEEPLENEMVFESFFDSFDDAGFSFSFGDDSDSSMVRMQEQLKQSMKQLEAQMEQMLDRFSDSSFIQSFHFDTTFSFNNFGDSSFFKSFNFDTIMGEMPQRSNPFFNSPDRDLVDFPDTEPSYIGGEEAMNAFIQRKMDMLEDTNKKGTVFIEAIVEKDGSISNSRVALGVDNTLDSEAIRIINAMPFWKPASLDGQTVRSRCIIPIEFGRD